MAGGFLSSEVRESGELSCDLKKGDVSCFPVDSSLLSALLSLEGVNVLRATDRSKDDVSPDDLLPS